MIFSENRYLLFRIMLAFLFEHHLFGKPVPTFPDHALDAERAAQTRATPESVSLVAAPA
jgi:hypothetical protein